MEESLFGGRRAVPKPTGLLGYDRSRTLRSPVVVIKPDRGIENSVRRGMSEKCWP